MKTQKLMPTIVIGLTLYSACVGATNNDQNSFVDRFSWRGFATINYSLTGSNDTYDRYIDKNGTFEASSIVGIQANYQISPSTNASFQVALAREVDGERGVRPTLRWAYINHRFSEGWQIRLGRQRFNIYQNSENLEIGSTYTQATLQKEVYINPGYLSGEAISLSKSFAGENNTSTEFGLLVGERNLKLNQVQGVSSSDTRVEVVNLYASHEIAWNTSFFVGYLEFRSDVPTTVGVTDNLGKIYAVAVTHAQGRYSGSLEYTKLKLDSDLINSNSPASSSLEQAAEGWSLLVDRSWPNGLKPYVGAAYYNLRDANGQHFPLNSYRLGTNYHYDGSTVLKAEINHVSTNKNPSQDFFNAPIGSRNSANVITFSFNKLF